MGKIDKIKEDIGALKTYLGFIVALIITIGAGIPKLYLDQRFGPLFMLGTLMVMALAAIFALLSRSMHKNSKNWRICSGNSFDRYCRFISTRLYRLQRIPGFRCGRLIFSRLQLSANRYKWSH